MAAEEGQVISCHTVDQWKEQFEKGKESKKLVVVDFTASWCGPCRFISPFLAELAKKMPNVIFLKVDVDELEPVSTEWSVEAMPTKKLIRNKGTVHPSPVPLSDKLSFLPASILTLMVALSPEEKEVLAYLISSPSISNLSGNRKNTHKPGKSGDHSPYFNCNCFECYMSYWVKWDSSPNHQLIHEIIDAFEDGLAQNKREKNRRKRRCGESSVPKRSEVSPGKGELGESQSVDKRETSDAGDRTDEGYEKSSVRKFVSFLGERIWSVWT